MISLKALHVLQKVSKQYHLDQQSYSNKEIKKNLEEVKRLSTQKDIPKLTLQKKIMHLENKMETLFALKQKLKNQKKKEKEKIAVLKKKILTMKKQMEQSKDKNLSKKVDKLSHLLAESVVKRKVKEDVALSKKKSKSTKKGKETIKKTLDLTTATKVKKLKKRLDILKHELETNKKVGGISKEKLTELEERIISFEQNLNLYAGKESQEIEIKTMKEEPVRKKVRHTFVFNHPKPKMENLELEKELPLPPPPKMEIN